MSNEDTTGWHKVDSNSDGDDLTSQSEQTQILGSAEDIGERLDVYSAFEGQMGTPTSVLSGTNG